MALILFDTNIFIDMLNGVHQATVELSSYDMPAISAITYMELRCGQYARPHEKAILDAVLAEFEVIDMNREIMDAAIAIRGNSLVVKSGIKLPDALIGATALTRRIPIVTRNRKDFATTGVTVHVPYDYDSRTEIVSNVQPTITLDEGPRPTLTRIR